MAFKIGNVHIHNNLVLAPMAGITNEAFRVLCKDLGAGLVVAEMVSDKGLTYQNEKTHAMIRVSDAEHPIAMQVFGSNYDTITEAALLIQVKSNADIIDVNMGCPVPKVVNKGSGSALLKTPQKIYDIVKSLKENISLPITVKIRAGWDMQSINCDEVARLATLAGADAITIHGRTRSQMYRGEANLDYIKMVRDATDIPVIGNGDIKSVEDALKMMEYTKVDALMIGRGAMGNPWIFRDLDRYFAGLEALPAPNPEEIVAKILEHAQKLMALKGERVAMIEMRGHLGSYFRRLPYSKAFRPGLVSIKTYQELSTLCFNYLQALQSFGKTESL